MMKIDENDNFSYVNSYRTTHHGSNSFTINEYEWKNEFKTTYDKILNLDTNKFDVLKELVEEAL